MEQEGRAASEAAAVRVSELEATLVALRGNADVPEAELRSQAAEVRMKSTSTMTSVANV